MPRNPARNALSKGLRHTKVLAAENRNGSRKQNWPEEKHLFHSVSLRQFPRDDDQAEHKNDRSGEVRNKHGRRDRKSKENEGSVRQDKRVAFERRLMKGA